MFPPLLAPRWIISAFSSITSTFQISSSLFPYLPLHWVLSMKSARNTKHGLRRASESTRCEAASELCPCWSPCPEISPRPPPESPVNLFPRISLPIQLNQRHSLKQRILEFEGQKEKELRIPQSTKSHYYSHFINDTVLGIWAVCPSYMFNRGETEIQKFSGQKAKSNQEQQQQKRQNKTPYYSVTRYMMRRWCDEGQDI